MFVPRISFIVAVVSSLCICITARPGTTGTNPLAGQDAASGPDLQKLSLKHGVEVELYGNGLYYFPPVELKVSWDDAKRICESIGMNSLYIDTPEEYDWINLALYAKKRWDMHHWTSGKKDGKWIWDATREEIRDIRWHAGYSGILDSCLGVGAWVSEQHQTKVFDYGCKNQYSPICKVN